MENSTIAALRSLVDLRFPTFARKTSPGVCTGVGPIDDALGGGLPPGQLTELVSTMAGSGGQLVLARLLVTTRAERQRVALVDGVDGFSPESVPMDALRHLVWIRPRTLQEALAAADVLVRDGNYAVVVLDLRGMNERALLNTPKSLWHRLQRAAESRPAAVLVQTTRGLVPAVPWRLTLSKPFGLAASRLSQEKLLAQLTVEIVRGHVMPAEELAG
ncbi:MAG: hypothetical protein JWM88_1939 [Verrucomicrobia bacterium]|nr:hypothetical protein [Verrucomicrobiota bacterium]